MVFLTLCSCISGLTGFVSNSVTPTPPQKKKKASVSLYVLRVPLQTKLSVFLLLTSHFYELHNVQKRDEHANCLKK